jgi:hypothetical protein
MTNESKPGGLAKFFGDIDLPKILGGEGLKALSRLTGGFLNYPAAWLERATQQVKDRTEAKSTVIKKLAEAAGNRAAEDPELVERTIQCMLPRELRRQENKDAVALRTIDLISNDPRPATDTAQEIEDDWLNVFERYAEDATSDKLRDMWARVLAGEIRRPGLVSLRTLRFIAELDQMIAGAFDRHLPFIIEKDCMVNTFAESLSDDFLHMLNYGLLTARDLVKSYRLKGGEVLLAYCNGYLSLQGTSNREADIYFGQLSVIGVELAEILAPQFDPAKAVQLAGLIEKDDLSQINFYPKAPDGSPLRSEGLRLWDKDTNANV